MIIWACVIIPILAVGVLYWKFHKKLVWWEIGILLASPIILAWVSKLLIETSQTSDTEFWGGWVTTAEFYEAWNEKVSCRHPIPCSHPYYTTDSKGRRVQSGYQHSNDGHYHPFDVDDHPEYWQINESNGQSLRISEGKYKALTNQFGNQREVELNRPSYTIDGDKFVTVWKGEDEKLEPVTTKHTYENRVQASSSIFNYRDVDPETYGLHEYPGISGYKQKCVLGNAGASTVEGSKRLAFWNAKLGRAKQVRMFILVYKNQPMQAAVDQESYWKGGNKNEFTVCIGTDNENKVQWSYVFSWSEVEILKVEARNFVMGLEELDVPKVADWMGNAVREKFVRKEFADFSYLTVEPPLWAVLVVFLLTLLTTGGFSLWFVKNDIDSVPGFPRFGRRRFS